MLFATPIRTAGISFWSPPQGVLLNSEPSSPTFRTLRNPTFRSQIAAEFHSIPVDSEPLFEPVPSPIATHNNLPETPQYTSLDFGENITPPTSPFNPDQSLPLSFRNFRELRINTSSCIHHHSLQYHPVYHLSTCRHTLCQSAASAEPPPSTRSDQTT